MTRITGKTVNADQDQDVITFQIAGVERGRITSSTTSLGGFTVGSSYLLATSSITAQSTAEYPSLRWTLGGSFWTASSISSSVGSDLAINGSDPSKVDVLTSGWYQATATAYFSLSGDPTSPLTFYELIISFEAGEAVPHFAQQGRGTDESADPGAQATVTTPVMYVAAGKQLGNFVGGYRADNSQWLISEAGLSIVRFA